MKNDNSNFIIFFLVVLIMFDFAAISSLSKVVSKSLKLSEYRLPHEWAKDNLTLPASEAEAGTFNPSRTPYFVQVEKLALSGKYKRLGIMSGAQMGKTMFILNFICKTLTDEARPMLIVLPAKKLAENYSRFRFMPHAKNSGVIDLVKDGERSNSYEKLVNDVPLYFVWATSANELCSRPACKAVFDELDRMPDSVEGEGNPVVLAETRSITYPDRFSLAASTPTIKDFSPIESLFLEGTQHKFNIPCKNCCEYFLPEFKLCKWEGKTEDEVVESARLVCPTCDYGMNNQDIKKAIQDGLLLSGEQRVKREKIGQNIVVGKQIESKTFSVWISGICSPWNHIGEICWLYVAAANSNENKMRKIQAVKNTRFGELFELEGERVDWKELLKNRMPYKLGSVPTKNIKALVMGVDVQKRCLVFSIRGFTDVGTSYQIDYGRVMGSPKKKETWLELEDKHIKKDYPLVTEDSTYTDKQYKIQRVLIDEGYETDEVRAFARKSPYYLSCKGVKLAMTPIAVSRVDVNSKLKRDKRPTQLVKIWDEFFKGMLYEKMKQPLDEQGSYILAEDVDEAFLKEVTGEIYVTTEKGGEWRTLRTHDFLDTEKLCLAGGLYVLRLGANRYRKKT